MGQHYARGIAAAAVIVSACSAPAHPPEPEPTSRARLGVGEPVNGYPSYEERVQLVAINRVRSDPNNEAAGTASSCSSPKDPVPPVMYDLDLAQAARFHCVHSLINQGGLSHKSFCDLEDDLETSGCNGEASCSCVPGTECWTCDTLGGCGTSPAGRAAIFGFTGSSIREVGAAGSDAWGSVRMWTGECPPNEGHRNILSTSGVNVVGTGFHRGSGCWSVYAFSDFGKVDGLQIARIPSGIHRGNTLYANYYDPAGDPQSIHVIVDGNCHAMEIEIGAEAKTAPLTAIDLSAPDEPAILATLALPGGWSGYGESFAASTSTDLRGFASSYDGTTFWTVNVSDPESPIVASQIAFDGLLLGYLREARAFARDNDTTWVFDPSTVADASAAGSIAGAWLRDPEVEGDTLRVHDGQSVFSWDVSDVQNPTAQGELGVPLGCGERMLPAMRASGSSAAMC